MKENLLIYCLFVGLIIITAISCKPKDDRDFVIEYLETAKKGDINSLKKHLTYESETKEYLEDQLKILIHVMRYSDIPMKNQIENIISNGEIQSYKVVLEPNNTIFVIDIIKLNNATKILDLYTI